MTVRTAVHTNIHCVPQERPWKSAIGVAERISDPSEANRKQNWFVEQQQLDPSSTYLPSCSWARASISIPRKGDHLPGAGAGVMTA